MKDITDRALGALNPSQRTAAIFAALSRSDFTDAHRLGDTAPRGTYVAGDFITLFTRAMMLAGLARGDIEQQVAGEWANRCFWVTRLHGEGEDDKTLDAFWTAAGYHRTRAGSLWSAYAQVVSEAGMDPSEVMRSMGALSKLAQDSVDACTEAEPDPDAGALYAAMLKP